VGQVRAWATVRESQRVLKRLPLPVVALALLKQIHPRQS
jgi:hypothetical protein